MPYTPITTTKSNAGGYQPITATPDQGSGYRIGPMTLDEVKNNKIIDISGFKDQELTNYKPGTAYVEPKKTVLDKVLPKESDLSPTERSSGINIKVPFTNRVVALGGDQRVIGNKSGQENLLSTGASLWASSLVGFTDFIPKAVITINNELKSFGKSTEEKNSNIVNNLLGGQETYKSVNKDIEDRIKNGEGVLSAYMGAISQKALDVTIGASVAARALDTVSKILSKGTTVSQIEAWKTLGSPTTQEELNVNFNKLTKQIYPRTIGADDSAFKIVSNAKKIIDSNGLPSTLEVAKRNASKYIDMISRETKLSDPIWKLDIFPKNINSQDINLPRLPGYVPMSESPAFGLSTQKVKPVGFGEVKPLGMDVKNPIDTIDEIANVHIQEAKNILKETSTADLASLGGKQAVVERAKINLVDGLKAINNTEVANAINAIPVTNSTTIEAFDSAVKNLITPVKAISEVPLATGANSLLALHNLSTGKLAFAQKIGGLVNPSVAVVDIAKQGFTNYGDISLVASKELLQQGKTFASDIYSPRFPSLTTRIPAEGSKVLESTLKKYESTTGEKFDNLDLNDFDRTMQNSSLALSDFISRQGIELPKIDVSTSGGKYDMKNALRDIIQEKGFEDKFVDYLSTLKSEIGSTEHIFKGFTYSGNRKYVPATIENISKDMKSRGLADSEGMSYGLGSLRAKLVPKLSSIKKIQEAKSRIVSTEEFEKAREVMNTKYSDLLDEYIKRLKKGTGSDNPFINMDEVSSGLGEYLTGKFPQFLDRFTSVPESLMEKTKKFAEELKSMPTEYFESKFTRPVKLGEFSYAVVPDTLSPDMIKKLEEEGIKIVKYKQGDEVDRLSKVKELTQKTDIAFSRPLLNKDIRITEAQAQEIIKSVSKNDLKLFFTDKIDGGALGEFIKNPVIHDTIRLVSKDGKVGLTDALHETKHYLFSKLDAGIQKEAIAMAQKEIGPMYRTVLEKAYSEKLGGSYAGAGREDALMEEYIVDKWAKSDATKDFGYKKSVYGKVFEALDRLLKKLVDTYKSIKSKINAFVKEAGGSQKGAINLFEDFKPKKVSETAELETAIETELGLSEDELARAVDEFNQLAPKKTYSKTPMKDFVTGLTKDKFSALKPDQQAYVMKYASEGDKANFEKQLALNEARSSAFAGESMSGETGSTKVAVKEVLSGSKKINLKERKSEFRQMFGDYLYNKINDPKATPLDVFIEYVNKNLSERIEIDDFLEAMWREIKQKKELKPIQLEARREFREARQAQIKRRFNLEQVAKKLEKAKEVKSGMVAKLIESKRKLETELTNLIKIGKSRKEKIETVQDYFGLTDYEMSKVQGRKDVRTMNEAEFDQFLHEVSNKAQLEVELADARAQVKGTIYTKELVGWENLQKAMNYPPIDKMSITQLKDFDKVLSQYEAGDVFLSQRKLETIENTDFKGVKTLREARVKVAEKIGVDPSQLNIDVSEFDRFRWDTSLAERNPFYRYFVEGFNASILEGEAAYLERVNTINELFGKVKGRGKIVPQDKSIMQYLESTDKETIAKTMTPEEITAAEYVRLQLEQAYKYELETKMLKGSRYEDIYVPHIQRTFYEAVKDSGVKQAFREMFEQHKMDEKVMTILDQRTGEILPYEKFFRFALMRSGEVIPTQNVARAFLQYMKAFERKRALDRIIPEIMTSVDVVSPRAMTERGLAMDERLKTFVTEYLNTKKGRPVKMFVKPGGSMDFVIKSVKSFTNLMDLAINIPLQLGSRGGAEASTYVELGPKKYIVGKTRLMTKQGKDIVKKFENFTGRTPWNDLHDASQGLPEKMHELMFALFRDATVKANKTFLLGNLTKEEWATGNVTPARLATLQIDLGRWLPVEGTKSIAGATTEIGLLTQYRTWAFPILRTTVQNLIDLSKMIKSGQWKKAGKSREFLELFRVAQVTAVVSLVALAMSIDPKAKNQSFVDKTISNAVRDSLSIVSAYDPGTWMNGVRILGFTESLMTALSDLVRLTEYKASSASYKKGDLKGVNELQSLFTPSIMRQLSQPKTSTAKKSSGLMF